MISQQRNDELTKVGPGEPAGSVLRQYWMPAALSEELIGARPVVPVTLMGERLVLFRDGSGTLGLISRHCPHRGADLCFGRLEEDGLRCPFHGWHFDTSGQCLEQPAEPEGSELYKNIKATNYPVVERQGVIWAFLGAGDPPPFPGLDCFTAPDSHVFAFKGLWECNWLQALEVGIDPAHASFLHRFLEDEDPDQSYGKQFRDRAASLDMPMTQLLREFPRPDLQVEETDYGLRLIALRDLKNGNTHVRVTNHIFPCAITIPMSNEMTITQWHVPIDDRNCYWYSLFTSFGDPVDKHTMREQRLKEHHLPDYRPLKNRLNNYGYDPDEQASQTWTGMGMDINVHDQWACEGMGAIQDRTQEHLGQSDIGIMKYRRKLQSAMRALAKDNPGALPMAPESGNVEAIAGPLSIDAIAPTESWQESWKESEAARRKASSWATEL